MNLTWLKDRAVNVIIYGVIILGVGFVLYSAFLKPSNSQKTTVQAGGEANYYWQGAKVDVGFGGCASFPQKPREIK